MPWRLPAWFMRTFPDAVRRNRFLAPLLFFSFGMTAPHRLAQTPATANGTDAGPTEVVENEAWVIATAPPLDKPRIAGPARVPTQRTNGAHTRVGIGAAANPIG